MLHEKYYECRDVWWSRRDSQAVYACPERSRREPSTFPVSPGRATHGCNELAVLLSLDVALAPHRFATRREFLYIDQFPFPGSSVLQEFACRHAASDGV